MAKIFGHGSSAPEAVATLTLSFDAGQVTPRFSPSGCGKSTLLRMIEGLEAPGVGNILLNTQALRQMQAQGAMAMARS